MPLVLGNNPALLPLQPLAQETQANDPPTVNTYGPEVEKWRQQVWDNMPQQLKSRPDASTLLDKALYAMHYESGGSDTSVGDGGAAWGLFQSHHIPAGSDANTQINDMWRLVSKNPDQWTDWGEGATWEGKPFGAFGNHPYDGSAPQAQTSGAIGGTAQATLPQAQPQSAPPQSNKPVINYVSDKSAADEQPYIKNVGSSIGNQLTNPVNQQTGGVDQQYGPFDTTIGQDYVDAPSGSPRAQLEAQRQGKDQLGNAAMAAATALPIIGAGPIAGPLGVVGGDIGQQVDEKLGLPQVNVPLLGKVGPATIAGGLLGGAAGEGEVGLADNPSRIPVKPRLRVVGPEERPGSLNITGKNKPDPADFLRKAREMGMSDDEIRSSFPGAMEAGSGIDLNAQNVARTQIEQDAKGAAAKRTYERVFQQHVDDLTAEGYSDAEAKQIATGLASREARRAAGAAPEALPEQKPNVLYSEDAASQMRQANENLRSGNSIAEDSTPGQSTGGTLAQEADSLSNKGTPPSAADEETAKLAYGARALGDPFTELRTQGEKFLKGQGRSRLQQVIEDEQNKKNNIPDQPVPPEQLNMLSDVLGQMSMQDEVKPGPGNLEIPPSTPLKNPGAVQTLKERLAQQEFERSQNVVKEKLQQATANGLETTPGEGDIVQIARDIKPNQQASLLNKDWEPGTPLTKTIGRGMSDLLSLPRSIQTRFDYSYPFRQGLLFVRRQREFWDAFGTGLQSLWKDEDWKRSVEQQYMNAPYNPQTLKLTKWSGGNMAEREELFYNRLIDKFPQPIRKVFDASEEAATIFINKLRSDVTNNVARKWLQNGLEASDPEFIQDLNIFGNYVNRATGYGNLGELEKSVGALNTVFYGARRNIAMIQAPGYLFNSSARVRVEAWKDFMGLFGLGATTLGLAQLAGIGDVNTFNPDSADWGKLKIGGTRLDIWGSYQQTARTAWKIAEGLAKDPKDIENVWQTLLPYLGNKLSPQASAAVSTLPEGIKRPIQPVDRKPFALDQALTPLAWQGLVDAIRQDGAVAGAIGVTGLIGTGVQTYQSKTDVQDKTAQDLKLGNDYQSLTPLQRQQVDKSPAVQKYEQENPSQYKQTRDRLEAPIKQQEQAAEESFRKGDLSKPLPEVWQETNIARQQLSKDLKDQFSTMFSNFDPTRYDKAVQGYFDLPNKLENKNPDQTPDWDKIELAQQDYLKGLKPDEQSWLDESLQVNRLNKSPMHQKYLNYIDERKKLGYFDVKPDDPNRNEKIAQLDNQNPQMDALNWLWKGGVTGKENPRLNSKEGVDVALSLAPDRPIQYTGLARAINQDPGSIEAWKQYGTRIDNYFTKTVPKYAEQVAKDMYSDLPGFKGYNNLDLAHQQAVSSRILSMVREGSPELEAALQYFGHTVDGNGDYTVSSAGGDYLKQMLAKYGNAPIKQLNKSGRPSKFLVRSN